ncbi:MAG: glutathione-disulfide reductase [Thioalkalivibrionaceae bacterium]
MQQRDVLIIGGGSGGLGLAERAAAYGRKVTVFDPNPLGGTCVNVGCVPKKLTYYAAHALEWAERGHEFGLDIGVDGFDYGLLKTRRDDLLASLNRYWSGHLEKLGVEHISAHARLVDANIVEANGQRFRADRIVIATGGAPIVPPVDGAALGGTSDDFFAWTDLPRSVAIIGAGYIGLEFAGMLATFGVDVTVIAMESKVLEMFDPMISEVLAQHLAEQGVKTILGTTVTGLEGEAGHVTVRAGDQRIGTFERAIWAVGRRPATRDLGLEATGVEIARNGTLPAGPFGETAVESIFALGDVTGRAPLTPVAIAAGRRLAERWFGNHDIEPVNYDLVPTVTFTHPPAGSVGLTETAAVEAHGDTVKIYETRFVGLSRAFADHAKAPSAFKLVCVGDDERVTGVHMIGEGVDEMLQGFAVAVVMGATKADFDRTIAIHPTASEELVTLKPNDSRPGRRPNHD